MSGTYSFNAGDRRDVWEESLDEVDLTGGGKDLVGQRNVEVDGARGVETRIDLNYVEHAADEQSGADEQSESQSGLCDDQRMMKPVVMASGCGRKAAISQGSRGIRFRHSPRGEQSEDK
jgi:hypothetical protein